MKHNRPILRVSFLMEPVEQLQRENNVFQKKERRRKMAAMRRKLLLSYDWTISARGRGLNGCKLFTS